MDCWEQQEGESNLWFDRFTRYRLMGVKRSVLGCYNKEQAKEGKEKRNSPPASWSKAAKKWKWKSRCETWDEAERQLMLAEYEHNKRLARQARIAILTSYQEKALAALELLKEDEADWRDVNAAIKTATEGLRKEYGDEPAQRLEHHGEISSKAEIIIYLPDNDRPATT